MLTIDRNYDIVCVAFDPIALRVRWEFPNGTPREVPGEAAAFGFQVYGRGVPNGEVTAAGTLGHTMIDYAGGRVESQCVDLTHVPSTGRDIAGLVGLKWKFGEVLPNGQVDGIGITRGGVPTITVRPVPEMIGIDPPVVGAGRVAESY